MDFRGRHGALQAGREEDIAHLAGAMLGLNVEQCDTAHRQARAIIQDRPERGVGDGGLGLQEVGVEGGRGEEGAGGDVVPEGGV